MPYLKVFDAAEGAREFDLGSKRVILGRDPDYADCIITDPSVSKMHAVIYEEDGHYYVQDMQSASGTLINQRRITKEKLTDGMNLQMGQAVVEFIVDSSTSRASTCEDQIMKCFASLPAAMGIRGRMIEVSPSKLFKKGDTLILGKGGALLQLPREVAADHGVVELELCWPDHRKLMVLGEILGFSPDGLESCVKLHKIQKEKFIRVAENAPRRAWLDLQKAVTDL